MTIYKEPIDIINRYKMKYISDILSIIPVYDDNKVIIAYLRPLTVDYQITLPDIVKKFTKWRDEKKEWFFTSFEVSEEGTKKWIDSILDNDCRMLFIIEDLTHKKIGHLAFANIDFQKRKAEIDAVIKGENTDIPLLMYHSINTFIYWGKTNLFLDIIELTVFKHNIKAIKLYKKCNFSIVNETPLKKVLYGEKIIYEDTNDNENIEYYKLLMRLN